VNLKQVLKLVISVVIAFGVVTVLTGRLALLAGIVCFVVFFLDLSFILWQIANPKEEKEKEGVLAASALLGIALVAIAWALASQNWIWAAITASLFSVAVHYMISSFQEMMERNHTKRKNTENTGQ
jgi:hypothetical protein